MNNYKDSRACLSQSRAKPGHSVAMCKLKKLILFTCYLWKFTGSCNAHRIQERNKTSEVNIFNLKRDKMATLSIVESSVSLQKAP